MTENKLIIEKISNGYLVDSEYPSEYSKTYCKDLQELFEAVMMRIEGKSKNRVGESYGEVIVSDFIGRVR